MDKRRLGSSGIVVTDLCMGTMTFGSSNTEAEGFAILDRAYDAGIDFYDTAELYPVPPKKEWVFRTEEIVGKWLKTKDRDSIILASKVAGAAHGWFAPPIRGDKAALDRHHIRKAIEGSLKRLQTDYIDLYQTHWPDHDFGYEETLTALTELQEEGLIRVFGSSNETPWGTMKSLQVSKELELGRYETIQNNFSIVNRRFEDSLADICRREKVSCLPYSPLGGGVCTGKYNDGNVPDNARFSEYLKQGGERQQKMAHRFVNERSLGTVAELRELAKDLSVSLPALCLAWCRQHDFVASVIFGATSLEQLEEDLPGGELKLSAETLERIDQITDKYRYPLG
ncbi:MAG: aldo/keto reductase [Opitutales bacterium]|nr:aldo/keto reductase [Opitutales bacterium]